MLTQSLEKNFYVYSCIYWARSRLESGNFWPVKARGIIFVARARPGPKKVGSGSARAGKNRLDPALGFSYPKNMANFEAFR